MIHTKGKWEVNPKALRNVRCGSITVANCSSGQSGENEEEEIANAKLIATAPEMLEGLEYAIKAIKAISSFGATTPIIERLENIIKKATE